MAQGTVATGTGKALYFKNRSHMIKGIFVSYSSFVFFFLYSKYTLLMYVHFLPKCCKGEQELKYLLLDKTRNKYFLINVESLTWNDGQSFKYAYI